MLSISKFMLAPPGTSLEKRPCGVGHRVATPWSRRVFPSLGRIDSPGDAKRRTRFQPCLCGSAQAATAGRLGNWASDELAESLVSSPRFATVPR